MIGKLSDDERELASKRIDGWFALAKIEKRLRRDETTVQQTACITGSERTRRALELRAWRDILYQLVGAEKTRGPTAILEDARERWGDRWAKMVVPILREAFEGLPKQKGRGEPQIPPADEVARLARAMNEAWLVRHDAAMQEVSVELLGARLAAVAGPPRERAHAVVASLLKKSASTIDRAQRDVVVLRERVARLPSEPPPSKKSHS